jgi:predicted nuclease with RNAse H fold
MRYCGVVPGGGPFLQLATLEEMRTDEPPIRLEARFYEPGAPEAVVRELGAIGEVVLGVGAPITPGPRSADEELRRRGVFPLPSHDGIHAMIGAFGRAVYAGGAADTVEEGAYAETPVFETHPDGVFSSLRGLRLPAKRHPFGIQLRIEELLDEHVEDDGGDLWHRRIEELEAVAVALAAHRFAVGHACWVGEPREGVIVLPGTRLPERFSSDGVIPPVSRVPLG